MKEKNPFSCSKSERGANTLWRRAERTLCDNGRSLVADPKLSQQNKCEICKTYDYG